MNKIEIITGSDDPLPKGKVKKVVKKILSLLGVNRWWLTISFVDKEQMKALNENFKKGASGATDVLTFCDPVTLKSGLISYNVPGDSIISLSVVKANASEVGCSKTIELIRVLTHSILHLLGLTHNSYDFSSDPMLVRQEEIVKEITKGGVKEWDF